MTFDNSEEMSETPEVEATEQDDGTEQFETTVDGLVASATPEQLAYMKSAVENASNPKSIDEFNTDDMPQ